MNRLHYIALLLLLAQFPLHSSATKCFPEERDALLGFVGQPICSVSWNTSTDCCSWENVQCNEAGHVISLDLQLQTICPFNFTIPRDSSLFKLRFLEDLRIVARSFEGDTIPESLANLSNLRFLLLSTSLKGQIPNFIAKLKNLTSLYLDGNILSGTIPSSLGNLANLVTLDLSRNSLSGNLPLSVFNLPKLQNLDLSENQLGGVLPLNVRSDSNLKKLWINYNKLTGKIPGWLFSRSLRSISLVNNSFTGPIEQFPKPRDTNSLSSVDLRFNQIKGSIPSSLFQHVNVSSIDLGNNQLSGAIEWNLFRNLKNLNLLGLEFNKGLNIVNSNNAVFNLPNLVRIFLSGCGLTKFPTFFNALDELAILDVSRNSLSGQLEFGQGWKKIQNLDASFNMLSSLTSPPPCLEMKLSHNNLAGDIPMGFSNITIWDISYNRFTGLLPQKVFSASSLMSTNVDLSSNRFSGSIPKSIGAITIVNVSNNLLSGQIPDSLVRVAFLDASSNMLSGSIPTKIGTWKILTLLDVSSNKLSGTIPSALETLSNLEVLDLSSNKLTGTIPSIFTNLGQLVTVDLSSNLLTGQIPTSFGTSRNFEWLDLSSNKLSGVIPPTLGSIRFLQRLDLSSNSLTGIIPSTLGDLADLIRLDLSSNKLSGEIPVSLGKLKDLEWLDLSSNALTGSIPQVLGDLSFLEYFNVSYNHLQGPIPNGLNFPNSSYVGNVGLCGPPLTKQC